jgi:hypothetical protein
MFGMRLQIAPMHEEAVAQAAEHAHEADASGISNAAMVVVVGNIQALVQTIFDAPVSPIQVQPLLGVEAFGWRARD